MGPYRFSTLRRLLDCPAQFLLADHDQDTVEVDVGRAGHHAMEQFCRLLGMTPTPTEADEQRVMEAVASRVLLADSRQTDDLRAALRLLPSWYRLPQAYGAQAVLIEAPIHVVLEKRAEGQRVVGSRPATPAEVTAGRSMTPGWLYRATVDYAVITGKASGRKDPSIIVDWKFDRAPELGDTYHRDLQRRLYALAAWIAHGEWGSRVEVQSVFPFLRTYDARTYGVDDFLEALADLEGLLIRADEVSATAPATERHARPGPRCATCLVSHACPAVGAAVRAMRTDPSSWVAKAEEWILLRRYVNDLELYLREKTRAEGPIPTQDGFEVGWSGKPSMFGVYKPEERKGATP